MNAELRPVLHRGVRAGLTRIKRLRWALIAWFFGWPVVGVVTFEIGFPLFAVFIVWCLVGLGLWNVLIWSRCPRCDGYFYAPALFITIMWVFRRKCSACGLDIRQLKR